MYVYVTVQHQPPKGTVKEWNTKPRKKREEASWHLSGWVAGTLSQMGRGGLTCKSSSSCAESRPLTDDDQRTFSSEANMRWSKFVEEVC